NKASENVLIENVVVQNSNRNNFTVGAVKGLKIKNCSFLDANGTMPKAGIDIEPDGLQEKAEDIIIEGCTFSGNITGDIIMGGGNGCKNVTIVNNKLSNSINIPGQIGVQVNNVLISNNIINMPSGSLGSGVSLMRVSNCVVSNNIISQTGTPLTCNGVKIRDDANKIIISDNVINRVAIGIQTDSNINGISNIKIVNNVFEEVVHGLSILSLSSYSDIKNNTFAKISNVSIAALINSNIEGNKFYNTGLTTLRLNITNCVVSNNQFENCGTQDKTQAMIDLAKAENCLINGNMFQSGTASQPPIYEAVVPTLPSVISNNFARYRSGLGIIKSGTILLNNYTL
ncbi:right-handed parallel beta-helix repeat-containing protein, partial [Peribacillus frigoritolerans]|uniref:right-handed parallel beta-helix repeat-containing protein n=1 Tax=Peribacillus frigoritolerans TaxID=450367 RepID=UPI002E22ED00|nr:right-handed parallel beta-helix repeat-containing protein [Peribacillus frigoritolerans]